MKVRVKGLALAAVFGGSLMVTTTACAHGGFGIEGYAGLRLGDTRYRTEGYPDRQRSHEPYSGYLSYQNDYDYQCLVEEQAIKLHQLRLDELRRLREARYAPVAESWTYTRVNRW